jgi:hypothetical protein
MPVAPKSGGPDGTGGGAEPEKIPDDMSFLGGCNPPGRGGGAGVCGGV